MAESTRCSTLARSEALDPGGTAGCHAGFCLIEVPLPWPADVATIRGLRAIATETRRRGIRFVAVVPVGGAERRRVILYRRRPSVLFSRYERAEASCEPRHLESTVLALLRAEIQETSPLSGRDVLLCTHGRRDICCGARGVALARALESSGRVCPDVRLWRASHLGGHRFAPTATILPEGTSWAFLDASIVDRLLTRAESVEDVLAHYRGCHGLESPSVQVVERAALADAGWGLLARRRGGTDLEGGSVRLDVLGDAGGRDRWEGRVVPGRRVALPVCGQAVAPSESACELSLVDLRRNGIPYRSLRSGER
ncbi:MAG: hypothetical protein QOF53_2907 [Nocardioidaceae bacterium]|nr:hypothetical protein [Nocardioidaceae bacterium]